MYFTGVTGKLNFYDGTNLSAMENAEEFVAEVRATAVTKDDGISTRKRYSNRIVEAQPQWELRYSPVDFNFIQKIFRTNEGNMSKFSWRYFDGYEYGTVVNCMADTFTIDAAHGRPVECSVRGIAENISGGDSAYDWQADSGIPTMTWRQTATLTVFGASLITDFTRWNITLNNGVFSDITGNVITPADVLEGKCDYTGSIVTAKKTNARFGNVLNDSSGAVVYALTDRAAAPATKTFTFNNAVVVANRVPTPMGLVLEETRWGANQLVIT